MLLFDFIFLFISFFRVDILMLLFYNYIAKKEVETWE